MRIAVASPGLGYATRGIEVWAADVAAELHRRNCAVILYKGHGRPSLPYEDVVRCWGRDEARTRNVVAMLPRWSWRVNLREGYDIEQLSFALALISRLRADNIDVLHIQDPLVAMVVQYAALLGVVRTRVVLANGTGEEPSFLRRIRYVQHLSPVHERRARDAEVQRPTWRVIPNFVDCDRFQPGQNVALRKELGIPADAVVVLTVAAVNRRHKRVDHLIREVTSLRQRLPALPIWIVVAGNSEDESAELIKWGQDQLGDRLRVLLRFPRQRMPELYRLADIFTLCSLREVMPIAVLEACASGLPCLVHKHDVLAWMIGGGGAQVDMSMPGVLAEALSAAAMDPAWRVSHGESARRDCIARFSPERVVGDILDYYKFVLSARAAETSP